MVNARVSLLIVAVLAFLLLGSIQASAYTLTYYSSNTTVPSGTIKGVSIPTAGGTCTVTEELKGYYVKATPFDIGVNYYSPDATHIGTATRTGVTQVVCSSFGQYSTSSSYNGYFEGKADYTTSATSGNITLSTAYDCSYGSALYHDLIGDMNTVDSYGNVAGRLGGTATSQLSNATLASYANANIYNDCYPNSYLITRPPYITISSGGTGLADYRRTAYAYYPFNSGSEGIVNYNFDLGNSTVSALYCLDSCVGNQLGSVALSLVKVSDGSYSILSSSAVNCEAPAKRISGTLSGSLLLDKNTEYMFVFSSSNDDGTLVAPCSRSYEHREPLAYNISVYTYEADWNCSAYSACDGGLRWRTCNDLNGISTDKTEFDMCSAVIEENLTLGFEDYETVGDVVRCNPTWLFGCGYAANFISVDRPLHWTVVENVDLKKYFIEMTADWATEGSRSVKLWFIPPKEGEPDTNTTCSNATSGSIPQIYRGVNDSFFLAYNVTFPSSLMEVGFDVKKCDQQQRQHYGLTGLFGVELCPEQCYSVNCSSEPLGRYYFNVIDSVTGLSLLGNPFFASATDDTTTPNFDLSDLGIIVNRTYNIIFAVYPENIQDTRGDCVMFDKVYYNSLSVSTIDVLGECVSQCLGYDWIEATTQTNGKCRTIKYENDARCLPSSIAQSRESRASYCQGDTTLWHYDNFTAKYISTNCEFRCLNGGCMTEEEYIEATKQDSTISAQTGTAMVIAVENLFSTPAFLALVLSALLAALVIKFTESWQFGTLAFLGMLGVLSFLPVLPDGATLFPAWFWIILIVVAGAIYAQFFSQKSSGGGQ